MDERRVLVLQARPKVVGGAGVVHPTQAHSEAQQSHHHRPPLRHYRLRPGAAVHRSWRHAPPACGSLSCREHAVSQYGVVRRCKWDRTVYGGCADAREPPAPAPMNTSAAFACVEWHVERHLIIMTHTRALPHSCCESSAMRGVHRLALCACALMLLGTVFEPGARSHPSRTAVRAPVSNCISARSCAGGTARWPRLPRGARAKCPLYARRRCGVRSLRVCSLRLPPAGSQFCRGAPRSGRVLIDGRTRVDASCVPPPRILTRGALTLPPCACTRG